MSKEGIYIAKLDQIKAEYKVFGNNDLTKYLWDSYPSISSRTTYVIKMYVIWGILSNSRNEPQVLKDLTEITN